MPKSFDNLFPVPVQTQHCFNVKEYYRMAETGVLPPHARFELLDGRIIDRSPIGPFHGSVPKYLNQLFSAAAREQWITHIQDPVRLEAAQVATKVKLQMPK